MQSQPQSLSVTDTDSPWSRSKPHIAKSTNEKRNHAHSVSPVLCSAIVSPGLSLAQSETICERKATNEKANRVLAMIILPLYLPLRLNVQCYVFSSYISVSSFSFQTSPSKSSAFIQLCEDQVLNGGCFCVSRQTGQRT